MTVKKTETGNQIRKDDTTIDYQQLYAEEKEKVVALNNEKETLVREREKVMKQYTDLVKKYDRLFNLYANNLNFYLNNGEEK